MRLIELLVENVKKIKVVNVRMPDRGVLEIVGRNGSGKTTLLDAIRWGLAGTATVTSMPIRKGHESALVKLDLGDVVVTRRFTASGTTVVVQNADGARYPSPQKMLDALLGAIAFDPMAFTRMKPREQYDALKALVNLDVDLDAIDRENQQDYEARKRLNAVAKEKAAQAKGFAFQFDPMDQPIDLAAIADEMKASSDHNGARVTTERERKRRTNRADTWHEELQQARIDMSALEAKIAELTRQVQEFQDEVAAWEPIPEERDLAPFRLRIQEAEARNKELVERERANGLVKEAVEATRKSDVITWAMAQREQQKAAALQAATMPVPGLSLDAGQVLLDGVPFDQASTAQQIKTSVAIAMAGNPKLRVALIRDGSLVDPDGMAIIEEMAQANDFLVLVERLDGSGNVKVVLEDGEVKSPLAQE